MTKYPNLLSPIVLGNTLFRNRIFASPVGYHNVNGDGFVDEGATAAYERKAKGGMASVATFGAIVDGELGKNGVHNILLDTPLIHHNLARIAHAVKAYGAVASLELQHTGMHANKHLSFLGGEGWGAAYAPVEMEVGGRIVPEMPEEIIERTIRKFGEAGALAKFCGFGMVTIHAGHGWLLQEFMSPLLNTRKDRWGGSTENRMRLMLEVVKAIRKEVGKGFPIEVRISGSECYEGGYGIETGIEIAQALDGHVDLIHVSAGNHEVPEVFPVTHPSMFLPDAALVEFAAEIKKYVKTPIATIGAHSDPALMEEIIASGKADVIEAARAFFAEPDFALKVRTGQEKNIKSCLRCFECFSNMMSNGEPYCSINPQSGRELEVRFEIPAAERKKILVVGGGVAGMEAALQGAKRGHEVILCEKNDKLGGVLRCELKVPFKKKLDNYLDQQARLLEEAGVRVALNTEATPEMARELAADVIIAALGAKAIKPRISGVDAEHVLSAQQAYIDAEHLGPRVLIIGAGLAGVELGIYLSDLGKAVQIVEATDHINDGGNYLHLSAIHVELAKRGLAVCYNTLVQEIAVNRITCLHEGAEQRFEADTVVYAVGQSPLRAESIAFNFLAPEFYMIGDCVSPRNMLAATTEAYHITRNIR